MSFVNLMSSDVWSDADITARTEALLRAQWSVQAQTILSRKAVGVALGQFTLSPEEEEELGAFAYASVQARMAGESAEADMQLLRNVLSFEAMKQRLSLPAIRLDHDDTGAVVNQPSADADAFERMQAQAGIDAATDPTLKVYAMRNEGRA